MQIKSENLPKNEAKMQIKLSLEETAVFEERTAQSISASIKIPGFRKGKAPIDVVKKEVGEEKFYALLFENFIPKIYTDAIKEEGHTPVSRPKIKIEKEFPIEIEATFATVPDVNVSKLDKIKIKAPKIKIEKNDVDETLEHILKKNAEFKEVDRKAKKGDRLEIDFEGLDEEGKVLPGTKSENHPIVIGEGGFIPGFEENLDGLSKDDEKEFTVKFPKDYHAEHFQNKKVKFKVKVHKVEEVVMPELDDKLIEKVTGKKQSKEEFLKQLEHDLEHQQVHTAKSKQEEELFQEFLKKCKFEVSDILIDEEVEQLTKDLQRESMMRGVDFETYKKMIEEKEGKKIEEFYREKASERVRLRFILDKLINGKKIEAEDKELEEAIKKAIENTPEDIKEKAQLYYSEGEEGYNAVRNEIILNKVFEQHIEPIEHKCN